MSLGTGIEPSGSQIPLKSGIRGLKTGARIYSGIQNPRY